MAYYVSRERRTSKKPNSKTKANKRPNSEMQRGAKKISICEIIHKYTRIYIFKWKVNTHTDRVESHESKPHKGSVAEAESE
jgi:hypothetical protein